MNNLDAIDADLTRYEKAIGPGGDKAWQAGQLSQHVRPLVAEVRQLREQLADAFNAGVEAAANAIETHAEQIGWYEGSGVWADAIEAARKAAR